MARMVAAMDVRMASAFAGEIANKAEFCRRHGVSRTTFYKWKRRFDEDGVDGLAERPRRPRTQPTATPDAVEDDVVRVRKELADTGCDNGPDSIRSVLLAAVGSAPSRATIARILTRRGQVVSAPRKRPRSSWHRFVYARPNECWQSDWTSWQLQDGSPVAIAATLDDHSRVLVGIGAGPGDADAELVWAVMADAITRYGIPARSLTDNGYVYSAARRNKSCAFEINLRALGCHPISSTPYHPQTCGKIERLWQTLKRWLTANGPYADLSAITTALTEFSVYYNTQRPHRALNRRTPAQAYTATEKARPDQRPLPAPILTHHRIVDAYGRIDISRYRIGLGNRWSGHQVTAIQDGDHIAVFTHNQLIRVLDADPTRYNQPAPKDTRSYRYREPKRH
jgi:transposase InsO family protein